MGIVTDLADFLRARWDEEEADSALFHELDCPGEQAGATGRACCCPCPAQIRERIATYRRILADCEQRIAVEEAQGVCWPLQSILAFKSMQALALSFELHAAWQESWYP
ncbi:DUF6221 family protein [Streptomyces sp. NPDC001139]